MGDPSQPLRVFLVAGEPSGDRLGAALIEGLRIAAGRPISMSGVGGPLMSAAGLRSLFAMSELSLMGFIDILPHLPKLLRRLDQTAAEIARWRPDLLVTIDAPGFNMRLLDRLVEPKPLRIHYVAPTVWGWRPGRARRLKGKIDRLLAILPFEPPWFEPVGVDCVYVGHPVLDLSAPSAPSQAALRQRFGIAPAQPLLLLLPGSRKGEVKHHLPPFLEAAAQLKTKIIDLAVMAAVLPGFESEAARAAAARGDPIHIVTVEGARYAAMATASAALAATGTVSIELARFGTPMVLGYRADPLSSFIASRLINVRYAGLPNLLLGREVVPEFFRSACSGDRLAHALLPLLTDPVARAGQQKGLSTAMQRLTVGRSPREAAAAAALDLLRRRGLSSSSA